MVWLLGGQFWKGKVKVSCQTRRRCLLKPEVLRAPPTRSRATPCCAGSIPPARMNPEAATGRLQGASAPGRAWLRADSVSGISRCNEAGNPPCALASCPPRGEKFRRFYRPGAREVSVVGRWGCKWLRQAGNPARRPRRVAGGYGERGRLACWVRRPAEPFDLTGRTARGRTWDLLQVWKPVLQLRRTRDLHTRAEPEVRELFGESGDPSSLRAERE